MNDRELLASLVKSLAWPLTVLIVLVLFRKPVIRFLERLKRIKYGDFEAEAEAEIRTAERLLHGQQAPSLVPETPSPSVLQYYRTLAQVSARATILEAWTSFETEVQAVGIDLGVLSPGEPVVFPKIFAQLLEAGLLKADEVAILTRFRELRNRVVHDSNAVVSPEMALRYVAVLQTITDRLKGSRPRP